MKYQVDIKSLNTEISVAVKVIRTLSPQVSLKLANEIAIYLSNHINSTLVAGISEDVALHIKSSFVEVGLEVNIKESTINSPMLLDPHAKEKWKWGAFRTIGKAI